MGQVLGRLFLVLLLVAFFVSACGGGEASPLIGRWSDEAGLSVFEFRADGKLSITAGEITVEAGSFQVLSPGVVELNVQGQRQRLAYTIAGDRLTLTDQAGVSLSLVRVK